MGAWKGYFDDSGKADDPQHCVVSFGGWIGPASAWTGFEKDWQSVLDFFGKQYMHMKEYAHSLAEFKDWKGQEEIRRNFFSALVKVMADHGLEYVAHCINLGGLARLNAEFGLSLEAEPMAIHLCLLEIIESYPEHNIELITDRLDKPEVLFGKVKDLAKYDNSTTEIGSNTILRTIPHWDSFKTVLPIQAADLIAYEALKFNRKRATDGLDAALPRRKSFDALVALNGDGGYWDYDAFLSLHNARKGAWPNTREGKMAFSFKHFKKKMQDVDEARKARSP